MEAPAPAVEDQATPAAREAEGGGLEEITVTAQRRKESQQTVPISISTVTAASAARTGIISTDDLGIAIPALQFDRQGAVGGTPFLRGVGTPVAQNGTESPVATYIDDVYISSTFGTLFELNNIQDVEVLKGPQGTLFGRNATGGVVHIHTKEPTQDSSLDAQLSYGSYDTYVANVYADHGVTDKVAMNLAAYWKDQYQGYGHDILTGDSVWKEHSWGVRPQLLWQISDNTRLRVAADYTYEWTDKGWNQIIYPGEKSIGGTTYHGRYLTASGAGDYTVNRIWGTSARLDHDFGNVSFVSISAYRNNKQAVVLNADQHLPGTPNILGIPDDQSFTRTATQEFQLLSPSDGPLKWILGTFYDHTESGFNPLTYNGLAFGALGGSQSITDRQLLNSYSGFGEASYQFPTGTKITAGLRYTSDSFAENVRILTGFGTFLPLDPSTSSVRFSKLTDRVILDQQIGQDAMVYASYSRGFRSGEYSSTAPTEIVDGKPRLGAPAKPEVLDAFEIGIKSELFDRTLRLNASAYHYNYGNMQVTTIQNVSEITLNAARARMNGVDLDWSFAPSRRVSFGGGVSYLDAKFVSFPNGPVNVPNPATCVPVPMTTGPVTGGDSACAADLSGYPVPHAPKVVVSLNATYVFPTATGDYSATVSDYHNSGFSWELDNRLRQPTYELLNGELSWVSPDKRYELKAYGRNLLNKYYYTFLSEGSLDDWYTPAMPRNFGGTVIVHF
jgi:iron complex outermembrane receptor protein